MSSFTALDVETASSWVGSICQIGLVEYFSDGRPLKRRSILVDCGCAVEAINFSIHGISNKDLVGAPDFATVWHDISESIVGKVVVSHTSFDGRAILSACHAVGLPLPEVHWVDSCAAARHAWPNLPNHKLSTLAQELGYTFRHHDAEQDALAAAAVFLRAIRDAQMPPTEAFARFAYRPALARRSPSGVRSAPPRSVSLEPAADGCLRGEVVVISGPTARERTELAVLAAALGAQVRTSITSRTTILVSGWPEGEGGQKLQEARRRLDAGQALRILAEAEFDALLL